MQRSIVRQALSLLETAAGPHTTVTAPFAWKEEGAAWRPRYNRIDPGSWTGCARLATSADARSKPARQNQPLAISDRFVIAGKGRA